jgi:serine/threonine protein kinase
MLSGVSQVVAAIEFCHSQGVIHRDLKPENLLCVSESPDSLIKLGDFGLSCHKPAPGQKLFTSSGTPEYVAPEVIQRPPVGYRPRQRVSTPIETLGLTEDPLTFCWWGNGRKADVPDVPAGTTSRVTSGASA